MIKNQDLTEDTTMEIVKSVYSADIIENNSDFYQMDAAKLNTIYKEIFNSELNNVDVTIGCPNAKYYSKDKNI